MHKFTRTIYSIMLECLKSVGAVFNILPGSTLNEKYEIDFFSDDYPTIKYFGIGLDYHDIVESGSLDFTDPLHGSTDGDVFRPVPLLVRPTSIGLTDAEKQLYRIIIIKIINGVEYHVCYLKKLSSISPYAGIYEITHTVDNNFLDEINLGAINALSPVPKFRDCSDTDIKFVSFDMKIKIFMNELEMDELRHAISIMYPDVTDDYVNTIGEVALYHGVEVSSNGVTEAASVQAAYFSRVREPIGTVFTHNIDIGGMTPYYL